MSDFEEFLISFVSTQDILQNQLLPDGCTGTYLVIRSTHDPRWKIQTYSCEFM